MRRAVRSGVGRWLTFSLGASLAACGEPANLSTFSITEPPERVRDFPWVGLADDAAGDGDRSDSVDGRAFSYYYDARTDTLWFRLELYDGSRDSLPAASVAIDIDADQKTGIKWYGANAGFTFEKLVSVGPIARDGDRFKGYNGVTDAEGVAQRDWMNARRGVVTFYADSDARTLILGIERTDIDPDLRRAHVIGSVGARARWNDDIGERGHATLVLDRASAFEAESGTTPASSRSDPVPTVSAGGQDAPAAGPRGRIVRVGDAGLRIVCRGSALPTLVVETGAGQWSLGWAGIQDALAPDLRVCTYDRRGLGLSEPGSPPRSFSAGAAADDLKSVLEAAGEDPPYILVGHSFGGYVARIFADRYPDRVAGIALVESGHEDQWTELPTEVNAFIEAGTRQLEQLLAALEAGSFPAEALPPHPVFSLRPDWDAEYRRVMTRPSHIDAQIGTIRQMPVSVRELRETGDLGDLPLLVISAENSFEAFPGAAIPLGEANSAWMRLQVDLLSLSSHSWHVRSAQGTHNVNWLDQELVANGLRALADTVRGRSGGP